MLAAVVRGPNSHHLTLPPGIACAAMLQAAAFLPAPRLASPLPPIVSRVSNHQSAPLHRPSYFQLNRIMTQVVNDGNEASIARLEAQFSACERTQLYGFGVLLQEHSVQLDCAAWPLVCSATAMAAACSSSALAHTFKLPSPTTHTGNVTFNILPADVTVPLFDNRCAAGSRLFSQGWCTPGCPARCWRSYNS